jgi:hypothetical protein
VEKKHLTSFVEEGIGSFLGLGSIRGCQCIEVAVGSRSD